jgi:16S rRNA (guanine527-N7)-methyltransferase
MTAALSRLEELVEGWELPRSVVPRLDALLGLLAADPGAPTTVTDPAQAVETHVADALDALALREVREATAIADLGAGAGFPGLVLALALPGATVALVESVGRKGAFMRRAMEVAGVDNASVVVARAEAWPDGLGRHDLVTARALAPLAVLAEYAAPLLCPGGALVAWKGRRHAIEEADGAAAAAQLGLAPGAVHRVAARPGAEDHHLHVMTKVAPTPPGFPRRPGMARKRPLGRRG